MRGKRDWLLAGIWLLLLLLWPSSADKTPPPGENGRATKVEEGLFRASLTEAPFGMLRVDFFEAAQGKKHWNIRSQFAELHRKENFAFLRTVEADFFAERTGNRIETRSRFGRSYLDKQVVDLEGEVSVRSRRGYLFEMDKLNYQGKSHEFYTDDFVTMKGPVIARPTMILKGTGFVGNIDTEHFVLRKNVVALKQLKNAQWLKIASKSGEFFTEEQRAVFVGSVRSTLPKVTIDSDLFELNSSDDKESMLARGNVSLKRKDAVGRAETIMMEVGSSKIVLEGNARVDSKDNQIRGRRIIIDTDEDRIQVESAEGKVN